MCGRTLCIYKCASAHKKCAVLYIKWFHVKLLSRGFHVKHLSHGSHVKRTEVEIALKKISSSLSRPPSVYCAITTPNDSIVSTKSVIPESSRAG